VASIAPSLWNESGLCRCPSWKTNTRIPNIALTVRKFMSTALTGNRTEPVNRNRTSSVAPITIASTAAR
jgi:hypothetical protein